MAISVTLLTACGGGNVTSTSGDGGTDTDIIADFTRPLLDSRVRSAVAEKTAKAVELEVQSGNTGDSENGAISQTSSELSYDGINVAVSSDSISGQLRYKWSEFYSLVGRDIDSANTGTVLSRKDRENTNLDEQLSVVTLSKDGSLNANGSGHDTKQTVFIVTDYGPPISGGEDSDYLAGGIWLWVPDPVPDTVGIGNDYEIGVFVDGNDPFVQNNVEALTSTATYEGDAAGMYTSSQESNFFSAPISLRANFGTSTEPGRIEGTISGFKDVNANPIFDGLTLGLEQTTIGDDLGGLFTGDTGGTYQGDDYTGKWGGRFYGNPDSSATGADLQPGSVAGTYGATFGSGADAKSFLGYFLTYKQQADSTP